MSGGPLIFCLTFGSNITNIDDPRLGSPCNIQLMLIDPLLRFHKNLKPGLMVMYDGQSDHQMNFVFMAYVCRHSLYIEPIKVESN